MIGAGLVTLAGFSWLFLLPTNLGGRVENPYIGLLLFIAIPIIFFTGLLLIPIGIMLAKRKIALAIGALPIVRRRSAARPFSS